MIVLQVSAAENLCTNLDMCLSCDKNQSECFECKQGYYVQGNGRCNHCSRGCLQCLDFSQCQQCSFFFTKNSSKQNCDFDTGTILIFGVICICTVLAIGFLIYYIRLRRMNKSKASEKQQRQWRSQNDPLLSPGGSKIGSRRASLLRQQSIGRSRRDTKKTFDSKSMKSNTTSQRSSANIFEDTDNYFKRNGDTSSLTLHNI